MAQPYKLRQGIRWARGRLLLLRHVLSDDAVGWSVVLSAWLVLGGVLFAQLGVAPLSGDITAHRYWLSAAFQGLAALFALFISVTLVMAQLASQVYTHRMAQSFFKAKWFWINLISGPFLLAYLLCVQTVLRENSPNLIMLVRVAFALSILYLALVPAGVGLALAAVRPRNIVVPILERIDEALLRQMIRRYDFRSFVPLPLEDNPLLEAESIAIAFLRQGEGALASATISGLFSKICQIAKPEHYQALCWHVGMTARQVAIALIGSRNEELIRDLVRIIANIHDQTFNMTYAGESEYTESSWPTILIEIAEDCARADFPEGARWCGIGLGWMAKTDAKNLPPDKENYWLQEILSKQPFMRPLNPTEEQERIRRQFENFDRLFIHSLSGIADQVGTSPRRIIKDIVSTYIHIGHVLREVLKQEGARTRQDAFWGISFELRKLIRIAERAEAWDALLDFNALSWLADFSLRDGDAKPATALLRVECDALIRAVEGGVACGELQMPIIDVTVHGCLSSLDRLPDGQEMVMVSVETLCKLAALMPSKYSGHGLGEDYDAVYKELGSRLLQIKRPRQAGNPLPAEVLSVVNATLEKYWPDLKEKYAAPESA